MAYRDYIVENFRWKLAALLVAIFSWFGIQFAKWKGLGDPRVHTLLRQPVRVLVRPTDPYTYRIEPPEVDVILRLNDNELAAVSPDSVQVFVHLADIPDVPGALRNVRVHSLNNVTVIRTEPRAVYVERLPRDRTASTNSPNSP